MKRLLVTRHSGTVAWAARRGLTLISMSEFDSALIAPGDLVAGNLPFRLAAAVLSRGGRFLSLEFAVPAVPRGVELDADALDRLGARIVPYHVSHLDGQKDSS